MSMKAYSLDLRKRVLAARQAGQSEETVADQFSVSVSFVAKLLARFRTTGSVAALPHAGGVAPHLDAPAQDQLRACLRQSPDATLRELRIWLAAIGGPALSRSVMGRAVLALDWRRKKKPERGRARHGAGAPTARGVYRCPSARGLY